MTSDIDNKEWPDDYPSLKQVNPNNPFTVPDDYFAGLEQKILSGVRMHNLVQSSSNAFIVPENYFEELGNNIQSRIALEEAVDNKEAGFTIPQNYFDNLTGNIQSRVSLEAAVNNQEAGFSIPQNYFEELTGNIQSRLIIENALADVNDTLSVPQNYFEELSSNIQSRIAIEEASGAETPFTVPNHYFEELNRTVLNQAAGLDAIQRRGMIRRLVSTAAFKYATAACFTLVVGAAIFIDQVNSPSAEHNRSYLHKALAAVPDNAIEGYLQLHMDASDTKSVIDKADDNNLNNISSDDLKDYLSNN